MMINKWYALDKSDKMMILSTILSAVLTLTIWYVYIGRNKG